MKLNNNIKVEKRSLSEQIYESIKKMILRGELKGGDRIPEENLAREFEVSRTPIREAIRRLDEYGIIKLIPRSYAEVVTVTEQEAKDVIQVRKELEILSIRLFAEIAKKGDTHKLKQLSMLCKKEFNKNNTGNAFEVDSLFHLEIARKSDNNVLYETLERLDAKIQLIRLKYCISNDKIKSNLNTHDEMIKAIESNDVNTAVKLIEKHIK